VKCIIFFKNNYHRSNTTAILKLNIFQQAYSVLYILQAQDHSASFVVVDNFRVFLIKAHKECFVEVRTLVNHKGRILEGIVNNKTLPAIFSYLWPVCQ